MCPYGHPAGHRAGRTGKKKFVRAARVAKFYGIDAISLSIVNPRVVQLYDICRPTIWAEDVLRERGGSLGAQALYDLTMLATGDKEKAEDARLEKMERDLDAGRKPEM